MTEHSKFQLPPHTRPIKYNLTLKPDLEQFTFDGKEIVEVEIIDKTFEIVLNAIDIEIQDLTLLFENGSSVKPLNINYDEVSERVTFVFKNELTIGYAKLDLSFTGKLNDRLHGFYRSTYLSIDGSNQTLATTQFEATDARRAFPCWDEPSLKAVFKVSLIVPSNLTAISNEQILSEEENGFGNKLVQFNETPLMSTYLLAFIIGDLEYSEGKGAADVPIRVWTTRGKAIQGEYALSIAISLLDYYNDYFGIPYPLKKLDHLAIPDFAAGAMENWGAITYRETALLFDPSNSAPGTRQRIAEIVAHEMAHMWFGDLVTMAWWNDLWLNESFASWMATKAVDHLFPEWDMWTQFISHDMNAGLGLDSLENSHPIEATVSNPAEISQLFDAISYSKGASIIRMLEQFIGPEKFRKGLNEYLYEHKYGNAKGNDLWEAMEKESGLPVVKTMESWIIQTGFPVLKSKIERKENEITINLSQKRFLYNTAKSNEDQTVWKIPVLIGIQGNPETTSHLVSHPNEVVTIKTEKAHSPNWIKINSLQTGFYRVQYEDDDLNRLIPAVKSLNLPRADRLGLQSDTFALTRSGLIPAVDFLELSQAYENEIEYAVWSDLTIHLRQFELLLSDEPFIEDYRKVARSLLRKVVKKVKWDQQPNEGHLQTLLRGTVLDSYGSFGDPQTLEEAEKRLLLLQSKNFSLAPELRSVVYGLAALSGGGETHALLHKMMKESTLQEEKNRLLIAMSRFHQRDLLEKTLELSLSPEVQPQDTVTLIAAISSNRHGGSKLAWEYVKRNWKELDRRYGSGGFAMMRLVGITGGFTKLDARKDIESFFETNPVPAATRTIQQSLERIDLNIRWLEDNRKGLAQWLSVNASLQ
jgi:puromycin-sensitive aminopeptidase